MYKPLSLKKELKAVPYVVKVPLYCLILGVIITAVLLITWNSPYALYVGVGAIAILLLVGISLGSVMDYNKKIKDHLE
jgi:glucose uptake protein GlcU